MTPQQAERLIAALEGISDELTSLRQSGIQISRMPDQHFVQVFNPVSHITGEQKPFEIESLS